MVWVRIGQALCKDLRQELGRSKSSSNGLGKDGTRVGQGLGKYLGKC